MTDNIYYVIDWWRGNGLRTCRGTSRPRASVT